MKCVEGVLEKMTANCASARISLENDRFPPQFALFVFVRPPPRREKIDFVPSQSMRKTNKDIKLRLN